MSEQTNSENHPTRQTLSVQEVQEVMLLPLGYREQHANSTLTKLAASLWSILGIIFVALPYVLEFQHNTVLTSLLSVFGALLISSAGIGTINHMYLRQSQLLETQDALRKSLSQFYTAINNAFLERLEWAKAIESSGIKNVTLGIPKQEIKRRINDARNDNIRLIFLSYAGIDAYHDDFCEALRRGCDITILTGNPEKNVIMQHTPQAEREQKYAEICLANLYDMKDKLLQKDLQKFKIVKFDLPTSIVAIQISSWICFGTMWSHMESFNGPWFEIDGADGIVAKAILAHIDSILHASEQSDAVAYHSNDEDNLSPEQQQ